MNPRSLRLDLLREIAPARPSSRVRYVCWQFGVPPREPPVAIARDLRLSIRPRGITLLTGPSGSGKSSLLNEIAAQFPNAVWVTLPRRSRDLAVVDRVAPRQPLRAALEVLTACGLGEPRLWVRRLDELSDGERFRAALAAAIGRALTDPARPPIFCDEFSAILHRRLARCVAHNLRKLVTRHALALVVATTHADVLPDLQPDVHVRLGGGEPQVVHHTVRPRPVSLHRLARIERAAASDYAAFAPMHYRHRDVLGFVDKVFLLRERPGGDPLGILVFAHPPVELALRNAATANRFRGNLTRVNRELRILRRLVMHPDVRGCGLGHWFVRQALPLVGVRFVECLAAMGAVNPVFEKAGMIRVGRCPLPRGRARLLERLMRWNVDPFAPAFARRIRTCPRVRELVVRTIHDWMRATRRSVLSDVQRKSPDVLAITFRQLLGEPPVYYLWDRRGEFPLKSPVTNPHAADNDAPPTSPDPRRPDDPHPPRTDAPDQNDRHRPFQ